MGACAVSALILLPVVNLSLEIDSATLISYTIGKVSPFNATFHQILAILLPIRRIVQIAIFGLKPGVILDSSAPIVL